MKIVTRQAPQGDVLFNKIAELPKGAKASLASDGQYVVAHSETGHNHIVMERPNVKYFDDVMNQFRSYLIVEDSPIKVEHQRSFDTHETLFLTPGIWEVRRQREYTAEGFRAAAD